METIHVCRHTHTHTQKRSLLHCAVKVLLNGFGEQINHYCYYYYYLYLSLSLSFTKLVQFYSTLHLYALPIITQRKSNFIKQLTIFSKQNIVDQQQQHQQRGFVNQLAVTGSNRTFCYITTPSGGVNRCSHYNQPASLSKGFNLLMMTSYMCEIILKKSLIKFCKEEYV